MADKKSPKISHKFNCEICDYHCNKLSEYDKHIQTKKHNTYKMADMNKEKSYICICGKSYKHNQSLFKHKKSCLCINQQHHDDEWIKMDKKWIKMDKNQKCPFLCECGKSYKYQSGLSKHKKHCVSCQNKISIQSPGKMIEYYKDDLHDMFAQLLRKHSTVLEKNDELMMKNEELLQKVTEIAKEPKIVNNTTNNTQFNVMNYLNNDCKDAMNFTEFIDNFEFTMDDLHMLANKGYQETMEHTFIKQLKDMEKTKRPIHCSDKKRKSFYVKENGVWKKDDETKTVVRGVKRIASRHFTSIHKWRASNLDCFDDDTKHLFFHKAMGQVNKCDNEKHMKKVVNHLSLLSIKY